MFEVDHKQGSAFGDDIVFVPVIPEGILKVGRGQAIHRVNGNLQSLGQSVCGTFIRQILSQRAIQHLASLFKVFVLDGYAGILDFLEPFGVLRTEQLFRNNAGGMHGRNIQQSDVAIHSGLSINIAALADLFSAVDRLAVLKLVTGKDGPLFLIEDGVLVKFRRKGEVCLWVKDLGRVTHIPVVELVLRLAISAKYNSGGQGVCSVVDCQTGHIGQDFAGHEVGFAGIEHRLGGENIVVAVFRHLKPHILRHRLIPREAELLVMDTQFDLPLFQRLLFGTEVVDIRVGDIIGLAKETVVAFDLLICADNALREVI